MNEVRGKTNIEKDEMKDAFSGWVESAGVSEEKTHTALQWGVDWITFCRFLKLTLWIDSLQQINFFNEHAFFSPRQVKISIGPIDNLFFLIVH